ncbi:H-2 class II histocompatibility antigen, E-S beta chain-like [Heteronotia binoei]|uniref:H-2 class II histocompatibility antigen, E-S beta chain-like n=1 Tax=Heteronotia binoei TaxID=13085 RepID=UPI00292D52A1|nr:H-2 class II histocompatibility antigen, E-S beta chain-like [Heteronotia binoei]
MGPGLILLEMLVGLAWTSQTERRLKAPAAHFLMQEKYECHFLPDGAAPRGEVWFLFRHFWDRQEVLRFDSRQGYFQALSPLTEPEARGWNRDPQTLRYYRAAQERFCGHNYGAAREAQVLGRTVEPLVKISPTKGDPLAHHTLLICTAAGYYPPGIDIKWLKNGQEQTQGVGYDDEIQNADWTYQYQVMLETVPQRGDVYACQVEHKSVKEPISVQWEPQTSDSAKSKVWTGAVGAVLGLVFVAVGLYLYLKSRKGLLS